MAEIMVVARKGLPDRRLLYVNHKLVQIDTPEQIASACTTLEEALGVKHRQITVKGRPHANETLEAGYYRLGRAYLGYRADCISKRQDARRNARNGALRLFYMASKLPQSVAERFVTLMKETNIA